MLTLNQIETDLNDDGKEAVSKGLSLEFSEDTAALKQLAQVKLDSTTGQLVFIRKNGEVITVSGLPTLAMFGKGRTGARGKTGGTGRNGSTGRNGNTGRAGCAGRRGNTGATGATGETGEDGPDGYQGETGYAGGVGNTGAPGPTGPTGVDGPVGNTGASCIVGANGATGPEPEPYFVFTQERPEDPAIQLWAYSTDDQDPQPLPDVPTMNAAVADMNLTALRAASGSDTFVAVAFPECIVRGGIGPFSYAWTMDPTDLATITEVTGKACRFEFNERVVPATDVELTVGLHCTVRDEGQLGKPTATVSSRIRVIARNSAKACLVYGSTVVTPSGVRASETVRVGDVIQAQTGQPKIIEGWTSDEMLGSQQWATVLRVNHGQEDQYIQLAGKLRLTVEHPVAVNRLGVWRYVRADAVTADDMLWNGIALEPAMPQRMSRIVSTVDIAIELHSAFYVSGLLVHNMTDAAYEEKRGK